MQLSLVVLGLLALGRAAEKSSEKPAEESPEKSPSSSAGLEKSGDVYKNVNYQCCPSELIHP